MGTFSTGNFIARTYSFLASTLYTIPTNFSNEENEEDELSEDDIILKYLHHFYNRLVMIKLLYTNQTPWSIGLTMSVMHEYSLCYVRSNIWPGAFTLGHAGYVKFDFYTVM